MSAMTDIFISYAHEDADRIAVLARAFEQRGCSVFWDRTIPPGQTWRSHIAEALNNARCVIVAWSLHSVKSHWVAEEADEGRKRHALIPILLDGLEPPLGFRSIQAADLTSLQAGESSTQLCAFVNAVCDQLGIPKIQSQQQSPASTTERGRRTFQRCDEVDTPAVEGTLGRPSALEFSPCCNAILDFYDKYTLKVRHRGATGGTFRYHAHSEWQSGNQFDISVQGEINGEYLTVEIPYTNRSGLSDHIFWFVDLVNANGITTPPQMVFIVRKK